MLTFTQKRYLQLLPPSLPFFSSKCWRWQQSMMFLVNLAHRSARTFLQSFKRFRKHHVSEKNRPEARFETSLPHDILKILRSEILKRCLFCYSSRATEVTASFQTCSPDRYRYKVVTSFLRRAAYKVVKNFGGDFFCNVSWKSKK